MADEARPSDGWSAVWGQDAAVEALRAAALDPVHAYLIVGPAGSGGRRLADAFAAEVLADGAADPARARRLVGSGEHPDLVVVERSGPAITADMARDLRRLAARPPVESPRKVIIATDFHLVREAGPILLKTLEEPSPSTVFVLLADDVPADLVTIASRCVRIELGPVRTEVLEEALAAQGVEPGRASALAAMAAGDVDRALLLAGDPGAAQRHEVWRSVPDRLDGTGASALGLVDELLAAVDGISVPVRATHAAELQVWRAQRERAGLSTTVPKDMTDRHRREERRARADELQAGLAALAGRLREAMGEGTAGAGEQTAEGLTRVGAARDALVRNPNERLLLTDLLLGLA